MFPRSELGSTDAVNNGSVTSQRFEIHSAHNDENLSSIVRIVDFAPNHDGGSAETLTEIGGLVKIWKSILNAITPENDPEPSISSTTEARSSDYRVEA